MRRTGRIAVGVESPSARKVSVSVVAETTVPVADRAPLNVPQLPRTVERILTREPSTIGQSDAGASCAANGEAATNVAIKSTLLMRNFFSVGVCHSMHRSGFIQSREQTHAVLLGSRFEVGYSSDAQPEALFLRLVADSRNWGSIAFIASCPLPYIQRVKPRTTFVVGKAEQRA
jgi:hypothetical protein